MHWFESDKLKVERECAGWKVLSANSVPDLMDVLTDTENTKGWVFRGQSNYNWSLQPSIFRGLTNSNPVGLTQRQLEKFKVYARGRVMNSDAWGDIRYWALGRHYGLKTPLLDWTASPFISAFFAFREDSDSKYRALYALNASVLNRKLCYKVGTKLLEDSEIKETFEREYQLDGIADEDKAVTLGKGIVRL